MESYNLNEEVELRNEQGSIRRVTHEVESLRAIPNKNNVDTNQEYIEKLVKQQKEIRFQIITGLVMEIQELDKLLE